MGALCCAAEMVYKSISDHRRISPYNLLITSIITIRISFSSSKTLILPKNRLLETRMKSTREPEARRDTCRRQRLDSRRCYVLGQARRYLEMDHT